MNARATSAPRGPESVQDVVQRLRCRSHSFSEGQLTRAVGLFLERYPGSVIGNLHAASGPFTYLFAELSEEHARAFVGLRAVPRLPRRVFHPSPRQPQWGWLETVKRTQGGRMLIWCTISDDVTGCPAADFTPEAIRRLVPQETPKTPMEWKALVRSNLELVMSFTKTSMIERAARMPVFPEPFPGSDKLDAALAALNDRFSLAEPDLQHLLAIHARLSGQLRDELLRVFDAAPVLDRKAPRLGLVVDNTRSPQP